MACNLPGKFKLDLDQIDLVLLHVAHGGQGIFFWFSKRVTSPKSYTPMYFTYPVRAAVSGGGISRQGETRE